MEDKHQLFTQLFSREITGAEFVEKYFEGKTEDRATYVQSLLKNAIVLCDADMVEEAITLLFAGPFNLADFLNVLCRLILFPWHYKHEDITHILADIKSPSSIESLFQAAQLQFGYLNYDDTFQLARKCIKVLSKINTENAIEKLRILAGNENDFIAHYAQKELNYKGL